MGVPIRGVKRGARVLLGAVGGAWRVWRATLTGVQKVSPDMFTLAYARPSRAIALPVACHRERLKEQLVVMGRAVLVAPGSVALWCTPGPLMPCVASDHHW